MAGFHTEYSGLRFSFFFFAEYVAMFIVGGVQSALFLGGWHDPFGIIGYLYPKWHAEWQAGGSALPLFLLNLIGAAIFVTKCMTLMFVQMWIRWTLPRPRIDQVLYACVKVLLPIACVLLLGAALWQLLLPEMSGVPWVDYHPFRWGDWAARGAGGAFVIQILLALVGLTLFGATVAWVVYAYLSGRNLKQRLTDPDAIDKAPANLATAQ